MSEERTDPFKVVAIPEPKPSAGNPAPAQTVPTTEPMRRLAAYVEDQFRINRDHRNSSGVNEMLEYAARCAKMRYSPRQEQILRDARLDPKDFPPLTPTKNRSAKAMLNDIVKTSGDKPYVLNHTPQPDIPKSARKRIMQQMAAEIVKFYQKIGGPLGDEKQMAAFYASIVIEVSKMYDEVRHREDEWARIRCDRMDRKIHDQLVEGHFIEAFGDLISYITTYGTALLIGPCPRVEARAVLEEVEDYEDAVKYKMGYKVIPTFEAVNPWDCFPAPDSRKVGEGPLCIKVRYTANALWQYAEAMEGEEYSEKEKPEGWQYKTVRALLSQYPRGGCRLQLDAYDLVRRDVERNSIVGQDDCTLEGIRCFSSVRGSDLISYGIYKTPADDRILPHRYYKTDTIVIGGYVVYCRVIDDRMALPVVKAVLYESPDSWWGDTIADYCRSAQSMQNNALKNLKTNGAIASNGIFTCNDVNRAVSLDGAPALALRAGRMLGFRQSMIGNQGNPVNVLNVPDMTQSLLKIMEEAMKLADDYSGIPQYSVGSSNTLGSGAGRTASGLAMMENATCRVVNMCVVGLGKDVIIPVVKNLHSYNLLFDPDISIKGDVDVNPSGLMGKILRESESQRRQQVTAMLGQHPVLSQAMTVEAFFELVRPELESLGINPEKIIPSKERMEFYQKLVDMAQAQKVAAGAQEQQPQGGEGQPAAAPQPQNPKASVAANPQKVALTQGKPSNPGTVRERRGAA